MISHYCEDRLFCDSCDGCDCDCHEKENEK